MARFSVVIAKRDTYVHAACFEEHARAVAEALRRLGHETVDLSPSPGRLIIFGGNNFTEHPLGARMPEDAIIFNSEQVAAVADARHFINSDLYRNRVVWDYSRANIEALRGLGIKRTVHCPVGYISTMSTIEPVEEDIDVLFYGSMNAHRRSLLDALQGAGCRPQRLYAVYGEARDSYIARAKIVLNAHYYARGVFEIFRVGHALANRKCVVTEDGGCDPDLEAFAARSTRYVPYTGIVEACRELLGKPEMRREIAERGYEEFKKIDLVESVRAALEAS